MKNDVGIKIRKLRELRGFSQDYMANKLSLSQRQYSRIERNEAKIDWDKIVEISDVLEINPLDLVLFDDTLIFNNFRLSSKFNNFTNNYLEKVIEQYEKRIKQLEEEINLFKSTYIKNKGTK